jgi:hypothetical protein
MLKRRVCVGLLSLALIGGGGIAFTQTGASASSTVVIRSAAERQWIADHNWNPNALIDEPDPYASGHTRSRPAGDIFQAAKSYLGSAPYTGPANSSHPYGPEASNADWIWTSNLLNGLAWYRDRGLSPADMWTERYLSYPGFAFTQTLGYQVTNRPAGVDITETNFRQGTVVNWENSDAGLFQQGIVLDATHVLFYTPDGAYWNIGPMPKVINPNAQAIAFFMHN